MDSERKLSFRMDNGEKQRFVGSVNVMIAMLEKACLAGGFTLKDAAECVQAIAIVSQFINGPLQQV